MITPVEFKAKKVLNFVFLVGILMFVAGCNGGGGEGASLTSGLTPGYTPSGAPSDDSLLLSDEGGEEFTFDTFRVLDLPDDQGGSRKDTFTNPEPATLMLFGLGLAGLAIRTKRQKVTE